MKTFNEMSASVRQWDVRVRCRGRMPELVMIALVADTPFTVLLFFIIIFFVDTTIGYRLSNVSFTGGH